MRTPNHRREMNTLGNLFIALCVVFIVSFAAWLTHVIVCIKIGAWGFLIAGALVFPIAIIHGIGIWLGLW